MLVALLALFVALGGTGYAALTLPRNSVGSKQLKKNAVTGKKIRKNAVSSLKVQDFSLLSKDFRAGELPSGDKGDTGPPGPTFGVTAMGSGIDPAGDPAATPDEPSGSTTTVGRHFDVTLPSAGNLYARFSIPSWGVNCTAGGARAGLYVDGTPVAKTSRPLATGGSPQPSEIVGVVAAGAGPHALEVRVDCPAGDVNTQIFSSFPDWTVLLLG
jgi:hypothetical protein